jgi:hypothetical protein
MYHQSESCSLDVFLSVGYMPVYELLTHGTQSHQITLRVLCLYPSLRSCVVNIFTARSRRP